MPIASRFVLKTTEADMVWTCGDDC